MYANVVATILKWKHLEHVSYFPCPRFLFFILGMWHTTNRLSSCELICSEGAIPTLVRLVFCSGGKNVPFTGVIELLQQSQWHAFSSTRTFAMSLEAPVREDSFVPWLTLRWSNYCFLQCLWSLRVTSPWSNVVIEHLYIVYCFYVIYSFKI